MQEFYAVSSKRCIGRKKYEKLYAVSKRKSAGVYNIERRKSFENKTKWKNIKKKKTYLKQNKNKSNATQRKTVLPFAVCVISLSVFRAFIFYSVERLENYL